MRGLPTRSYSCIRTAETKKTLPGTEVSEGTASVYKYWFSLSILVLPKPRGSEECRCTVVQVEQVIHERVDSKVQRVP